MKKITAFLLLVLMLLVISGCKGAQNQELQPPQAEDGASANSDKTSITLLYSAADTFNPYDAATEINRQLCKLLYDPLVRTDEAFAPHNCLAKSVKISKNICTVKLRDVKFTDGTSLTADDVVYSYKCAKKSKTAYKYKLYEVEKVTAKDNDTVVFKLEKNDPYFANVLDFPIIKAKSDKIQDSDSVKFPPIGCGRYVLDEEYKSLSVNESYYGKQSSIKRINLINSPDDESISHYVEIGATDMYYSDLSDGTIFRMSGTKSNINLNNLVYIGVNHNNKILAQGEVRQAISSGIDRQRICKDAYYNNAMAATGFFNPLWEETKALQNIQNTTNLQITVENLEKIGYNELNSDGLRYNGRDVLRFTLLVNKENARRVSAAKLISAKLKECGIGITVKQVSYKQYKKCLKTGDFDLYLGEVKISENMDLSQLVLQDGSAAYGIKAPVEEDISSEKTEESDAAQESEKTDVDSQTEETMSEDIERYDCARIIKGFYAGENSIGDVAVTLQSDMVFIPLCYRTGVLFYNENIENVSGSSVSDIYFSIQSYKIK